MKILLLGTQLTSLVNFRGPLIRDLIAAGHEVLACAPEPVEPWRTRLEELGARYIEAPLQRAGFNPLADLRLLFWLVRLMHRERPNVLLAFQAKAVIYGIPAAALAGVGCRVAMIEGLGQGFAVDAPTLKRKVLRALLPWLYRFGLAGAHHILFLNPDDQDEFAARHIMRSGQASTVLPGIGIDLDYFSLRPLPGGPVTFLMLARLLADKGVRDYAAAAALVHQQFPEVRFQLLGPVDATPAGIPLAEVRAWRDVAYLGETADVRPALESCHVIVLPTYYREGLPRSLLEGMATGRAIITTNAPGARETVIEGRNGLLVQPRQPEALAKALIQLIKDPALLEQMGAASRTLAAEKFDVNKVNRLIRAVLTESK